MNNSIVLRYFLLIILSIHGISPADAQKDPKEFPKPKVMTGEELQRMENERKQNEEFQKKQEEQQVAWARKYRIDEYPSIWLNDIFKFGFLITALIGILTSLSKWKNKRLGYLLAFIASIGLCLLHCSIYSKTGEFTDCIISGIKVTLVSILFSTILIALFSTIISNSGKFSNEQKIFAIIVCLLSTSFIAYVLTNNIGAEESGKSLFISYPWNWLGVLIINGFLYYRFKINTHKG